MRGAAILLVLWPQLAAADDPVARLAPAWTEALTARATAIDHGQLFVLATELRVFDLADGYSSTTDSAGSATSIAASGTRFVTGEHNILAAWQRASLDAQPKQLWTFDTKSNVMEVAIDDDRAYATILDTGPPAVRAVIAVSLATGKPVWRFELPPTAVPELFAAEPGARGVVAGHIDGTATNNSSDRTFAFGFDRATGAKAWQYTGPPSSALATNHRSLLVARSDQLMLVDRVTGHTADAPLPVAFEPQIAATDELAVLAGPADDGGYVVAVDLMTRRARLVEHAAVMANTPIAIGGPVIYVESPGGTLRAVDRFSGAHRWEWSVGARVALYANADRLIVVGDEAIHVFAPGVPPSTQDAVIRGTAKIDCGGQDKLDLLVGDTRVTTAVDGSYRLEIHGRGTIGIRFESSSAPPVLVPLVGRTRYHAPILQLSECGD